MVRSNMVFHFGDTATRRYVHTLKSPGISVYPKSCMQVLTICDRHFFFQKLNMQWRGHMRPHILSPKLLNNFDI